MPAIQKIVVGYDFSLPSQASLRQALDLAQRFAAELHVVHVIAPEIATPYVPQVAEDLQKFVQDNLNGQLRPFVAESGKNVTLASIQVVQGQPYAGLIGVAEKLSADLIVVGSHSRTWVGQMLLGSQTAKLVRHSPVPVYVHHAQSPRATKIILVPIDETNIAELAIPEAQLFAKAYGAAIQLVHVVSLPPYEYIVDYANLLREIKTEATQRLQALAKQYALTLPPLILEGGPASVLTHHILENADIGLVVLATHGKGALDLVLLGSVAEAVLRHSVCPVVTVHSPEKIKKLRSQPIGSVLF